MKVHTTNPQRPFVNPQKRHRPTARERRAMEFITGPRLSVSDLPGCRLTTGKA